MNDVSKIQAAGTVLMVRPAHFGFNVQTSGSNIFQKDVKERENGVNGRAIKEFDHFVSLLTKYDVDVIVIDDQKESRCPDAVFPNNWFSTHADGTVILYPMLAENRRMERRMDIFETLENKYGYQIEKIEDFTFYEKNNKFCEGTGSLVFDHRNKLAYCNLSSRTNREVAENVCSFLNYEPVFFTATSRGGKEIYHTNVLLTIAEDFAVVCAESIEGDDKEIVLERLEGTGHEIITIGFEQMANFAGNMLQVKNKKGELMTVLSKTAFDCLSEEQMEVILKSSQMLPIPVPVIEEVGGGSVRCMMAEVYLGRGSGFKV